ncbi:hypothetical protein [Rossellomorea sp. NPDC077527]|uniref:hypothetical protein n=1 Tax=Rossellomorea sp. NPDC077527 TaxID=3364510 RepID=UPI0037CAB646
MRQLSPLQLQQQIIHYKSEMEKYRRKCEALEDEYLAKKYMAIKKENLQLQSMMETHLQELQNNETQKNQETSKYLALLSSQDKEIKKLHYSLNQLKEQLRKHSLHVTNSTNQIEELNQKNEVLQNEILSLQEENSYLTYENDCLSRRIINSESQLYIEEIDAWRLEEYVKELKEELEYRTQCFQIDKTFADDENGRIREINQLLETQLFLKEIELYETHRLQTESESYYKYIIHFQNQKISDAFQNQKNQESSIQRKENEIKQLQEEQTQYFASLQNIRKNIKQMKNEVFMADEESITTKATLSKYENTIQNLQYTNALLMQEIHKYKNKLGS